MLRPENVTHSDKVNTTYIKVTEKIKSQRTL